MKKWLLVGSLGCLPLSLGVACGGRAIDGDSPSGGTLGGGATTVSGGGAVAGNGGVGNGGVGNGGMTLGCDVRDAIVRSCAFNICHGDDPVSPSIPPAAQQNLLSPTLETDLLNRPASYQGVINRVNCPNPPELVINQANPMQSLIIKKLLGTQSCGELMPNAGVPILPEDRQCLIAWALSVAGGP